MDVAANKAALRKKVRQQRATRSSAEQEELARGLASVLLPRLDGVRAITAYLALPGEPSLEPVIEALTAREVQVWLPVVTRVDGAPALSWGEAANGRIRGAATPTGLRLLEPAGPHILDPVVDVVLLPGLAVDPTGARLGQGAGYYDRTADRLGWPGPTTRVVSIVHDDEVVEQVPAEQHDIHASAICTPTRWIDCQP